MGVRIEFFRFHIPRLNTHLPLGSAGQSFNDFSHRDKTIRIQQTASPSAPLSATCFKPIVSEALSLVMFFLGIVFIGLATFSSKYVIITIIYRDSVYISSHWQMFNM